MKTGLKYKSLLTVPIALNHRDVSSTSFKSQIAMRESSEGSRVYLKV